MLLAYGLFEGARMMMAPARLAADLTRHSIQSPANPLAYSPYARSIAAGCEMFERVTRRYGKPAFGFTETVVEGQRVPVTERVVSERPFCRLVAFDRAFRTPPAEPQPKLLIVAPMSGHYATLLRGTVEAMLPNHQVFITDWTDARMVPLLSEPTSALPVMRRKRISPELSRSTRALPLTLEMRMSPELSSSISTSRRAPSISISPELSLLTVTAPSAWSTSMLSRT